RLREDGYLYLPGLMDREEVLAARRVMTDHLAEDGLLDPAYDNIEAVARPDTRVTFRPDLAMNNPALDRVLYGGALMDFYGLFFGEAVRHYDFTWLRAASPGTNTSAHCDIVYMGRGTFDVLTAWVPLGDIALDGGVLMMLEGSNNKRAELEDYLKRDVDTYCANGPNAAKIERGEMSWEWDGVLNHDLFGLRNQLGGRWLTSEFKMGDVLTFTMGTVHASLDNHSNLIRLSSDSRYQRASEPVDERWIGQNPIAHGQAGKRGRIC
ncbi:MAG TPA: phytanoyl-CoA dioxygenase family protein, partial [Capsulimonadaceae bacterium]|nr:phytanoyl-CoA dioxygenase family protein [Capsulimonadaceae bacterium]